MKQTKLWLGLLLATGMAAIASAAHPQPRATGEETHDGVKWSFILGENGAIVSGAAPSEGTLSVPSTLGQQPVTEIGYTAFSACEELTSVAIPSGVANIADRAFQYCSLLESISIPAGVTNIGTMTFQYCESLSTLVLPQSMATIGSNALYHCDSLSKLYVPLDWWGTTKMAAAGLGGSCTVVYGEPDKETVVFNANGGECDTASRAYSLGESYGWLPDPCRTYYTFEGWWTAANGGTRIVATDSASEEGRRVLYAQWSPAVQAVTFNPSGGTCETTNQTYSFGAKYSALPEAIREHFAFEGWWTSISGGERITEESTVTQEASRTLYAHWTPTAQVVTFQPNGGWCDIYNVGYAFGGKYSPLPKPTREGYDFDGWFTDESGGDRISASITVTDSATRTFYAHWTLVEQAVTFQANGGYCSPSTYSYAIGGTYDWLPVPTRDGWGFGGWYTADGVLVETTSMVPQTRYRTLTARWWSYTVEANAAMVTGVSPNNGSVVIPDELDGYPVTDIGQSTFSKCASMTDLTIPESVTGHIGTNALFGCTGLTNLTILGNVTIDVYLGSYASNSAPNCYVTIWYTNTPFANCPNLARVTFGDSVTNIGSRVFSGCTNLKSVVIGNGVTHIGFEAFSGCTKLKSVVIGNGVTHIGFEAFSGCSYDLYDRNSGVRLVDGWAVGGWPSDALNLGGIRGIADSAFSYCQNLTSVTIPDNLANIGQSVFYRCTGLTNVVLGNGMTKIGANMFVGCSGLTSVTIPDSVTSIEGSAFYDCSALTNVTIPDSVTCIGSSAFSGCSGLTSVSIPDSVTNIGYNAFYDCGLTSVTIPKSVTEIGKDAFRSCIGLTSVTILGNVTDKWVDNWGAFDSCRNLTTVVLGNDMTQIGSLMFSHCSSLTCVVIPNGVKWIRGWAFHNCSALTNMTIPDSVTSIGNSAFAHCSGLTTITIPGSVTDIGTNALVGCSGLKTLYAPASWKSKYVGGTFWSNHVCVPSGCEIVYYESEVSAATTTGVPHSWLASYGLGDGTAEGYEAAANAKAANGVNAVWECYVAGLNPTNPAAKFTTFISFTNGSPVVSWSPDLNEDGTTNKRVYKVEGMSAMTNDWGATNAASRFFRVKVGLP